MLREKAVKWTSIQSISIHLNLMTLYPRPIILWHWPWLCRNSPYLHRYHRLLGRLLYSEVELFKSPRGMRQYICGGGGGFGRGIPKKIRCIERNLNAMRLKSYATPNTVEFSSSVSTSFCTVKWVYRKRPVVFFSVVFFWSYGSSCWRVREVVLDQNNMTEKR